MADPLTLAGCALSRLLVPLPSLAELFAEIDVEGGQSVLREARRLTAEERGDTNAENED